MRFTRDQVGDTADESAHDVNKLPVGIDATEDDDYQLVNASPREARSYRLAQYAATPAGPATDQTMGATPSVHADRGQADARHVWGGTAGTTGPAEAQRPAAEVISAGVMGEAINSAAPIDRPRAGSTSADPTRPSVMPKWFFLRAFDQWAQYGVPALDKLEMASPIASRPLAFDAPVAHAIPSAGGSGDTRTEGVGIPGLTTRLLPAPWDTQNMAPEQTAGVAHTDQQRARGWGLR